uniref:(northern house mosquito) hypothetical protein n=1 Tax=Culex pipiens TaxID=7175 RepID=A0A8D8CSL3_CULPI
MIWTRSRPTSWLGVSIKLQQRRRHFLPARRKDTSGSTSSCSMPSDTYLFKQELCMFACKIAFNAVEISRFQQFVVRTAQTTTTQRIDKRFSPIVWQLAQSALEELAW